MFRVRPANRVPVCQVPRGQPPDKDQDQVGMRHRAGLGLSEETDAVLLVVSEETRRISLAVGRRLEAMPRENLSRLVNCFVIGRRAAPSPRPLECGAGFSLGGTEDRG
jgi:diadenylate cyclase